MSQTRRGTFRLPDSDPETETDTSEYRDAEEGPSGARTHESSSSHEPRQVEDPPEETNESEPSTNEDLSASFSAAGWTPFEPCPEPYNPFHIPQSPLLLPVLEMTDVIMNDHDSKIKEVKLNPPKPFDGKWENLKKFIQDGELYITINKKTYDDEIKKIGFFLSFMNEGDTASWKEQLLDDAMTRAQASNTDLNLGTYAQFKHDLQEAFAPYDSPGDALERMKLLRMKKDDSIDEHIARFRMLVSESKLDKSSPVIIDFFRETLGFSLQRRIMTLRGAMTQWHRRRFSATKRETEGSIPCLATSWTTRCHQELLSLGMGKGAVRGEGGVGYYCIRRSWVVGGKAHLRSSHACYSAHRASAGEVSLPLGPAHTD